MNLFKWLCTQLYENESRKWIETEEKKYPRNMLTIVWSIHNSIHTHSTILSFSWSILLLSKWDALNFTLRTAVSDNPQSGPCYATECLWLMPHIWCERCDGKVQKEQEGGQEWEYFGKLSVLCAIQYIVHIPYPISTSHVYIKSHQECKNVKLFVSDCSDANIKMKMIIGLKVKGWLWS